MSRRLNDKLVKIICIFLTLVFSIAAVQADLNVKIGFTMPRMTATNGMTKRHPHESQHRKGFTLITCPVLAERSLGFPSLPQFSSPQENFTS
jgi:hypothetical protein